MRAVETGRPDQSKGAYVAKTDEQAIAVSLSGGGHRATLYALGSLMALIDRGLNRSVVQVSSVSGGSILNAVLAHNGVNLTAVTAEEFDEIARHVVSTIARRGVLTWRWLALPLAAAATCGALAGWGYAQTAGPSELLFLACAIGAVTPLLWFGHFIAWRLRKVYLPIPQAQRMAQLPSTPVDHVFCASDLVTGFPVYITTWDGGLLWRRTSDSGVIGGKPNTEGQLWSAKDLRLADVVRASAGFPGIPPRRLAVGGRRRFGQRSEQLDDSMFSSRALRELFDEPSDWGEGAVMLLSDGGIVNNLGTQPLREDRFYQGKAGPGVVPQVLIAANASAPMTASHHWSYYLPGISVVSQLWRCLQMLNMNTVAPRVASTRLSLTHRSQKGAYSEDVDIITNLSESTGMLEISLRTMMEKHRDALRLHNPKHDIWQQDLADLLRSWVRDHQYDPASIDAKESLIETLERKVMDEPWNVPQVPGVLDHDALNDLTQTQWWANLLALDESYRQSRIPTTLGRLNPDVIRMLVLRGYMHTFLASLAVHSLDAQDLEGSSSRIKERIDSLGERRP